MSRRRSVVSAEPQPEPQPEPPPQQQQQQPEASAELRGGAMESPGAADDFLELEPDEELLCSVSDITEQLGRSVAAALDTALSEIRLMVSVRIRVLKAELRDKSDEIAALKARLGALHRDAPGALEPPAEAACRRAEAPGAGGGGGGSRLGAPEPRRGKAAPLGVKKENIDAICDYLMKDKNSRGGDDERPDAEHEAPEPHSLHLWPDSGVASAGAGPAAGPAAGAPDTESGTDELFSMLPSSSKRIYDYEWMAPMDYSSELRVMKEPDGENTPSGETEDEDDDDDEGSSRREEHQLEQSLPHAQPPNFSMEPHSSPGGGGSPLEAITDGPDPGPPFPSHTYICSLCGTFCPDSVFLEEHIKLIHSEAAGLQALQALQSTSGAPAATLDGGGEPRRLGQGQGQSQGQSQGQAAAAAGPGPGGPGPGPGGPGPGPGPVKREIKIEGGYECGDCGRHFNYLGNLRQHQRIHTGEKPFMCPECGERFRHAARLKSHRLVHSGAQSPFPCPQCGKGFSVLSGLKRHQRVHTGESPYACPQCGRRFKELGNLYTHQRIHSGATPYCCTQCGRSFRHLGTYKSHRCTPPQ